MSPPGNGLDKVAFGVTPSDWATSAWHVVKQAYDDIRTYNPVNGPMGGRGRGLSQFCDTWRADLSAAQTELLHLPVEGRS